MDMRKSLLIITTCLFGIGHFPAYGQDGEKTIREIREDFLVPSSPAFAMLGISPEEIVTPTTPKEFATSVLNGLDVNGNLQSGIALDFSPYLVFGGSQMTLDTYRKNNYKKWLSRIQVSFAITKGSDDEDQAKRMAIGVRIPLVDKADPRLDDKLLNCYDDYKEEITERSEMQLDDNFQEVSEETEDFDGFIGSLILIIELQIDHLENGTQLHDAHPQNLNNVFNRNQHYYSKANNGQIKNPDLRKVILSLSDIKQPNNSLNNSQQTKLLKKYHRKLREAKIRIDKIRNELEIVETSQLKNKWINCNIDMEINNWNATNVTIGMAHTRVSETGNIGDLKGNGFAFYASAGYGFEGQKWFEDKLHVIGMVSYRTRELVPDPNNVGSYIQQKTFLAGTQLRFAGPDIGERKGGKDLTFFVEYDYKRSKQFTGKVNHHHKWAVGMDVKITNSTSLNLAIGDESGKKLQKGGTFVISNVKWSF